MRFVIVTGMSGAGRGTSLRILEDAGYFCVDNLPISLISKFSELIYSVSFFSWKAASGNPSVFTSISSSTPNWRRTSAWI